MKKPNVCPRCEGTGREPSEYFPEPCSDCGGKVVKEYRTRPRTHTEMLVGSLLTLEASEGRTLTEAQYERLVYAVADRVRAQPDWMPDDMGQSLLREALDAAEPRSTTGCN